MAKAKSTLDTAARSTAPTEERTTAASAIALPLSGPPLKGENRRVASDQTRARGTQRRDEDSQDPDYINEQLNRVLFALDAFKKGDVSVRLTKQTNDIFAEIAEAYNSMVDMIAGVGGEVSRISKVAGVEGNLKARASSGYRYRLLARHGEQHQRSRGQHCRAGAGSKQGVEKHQPRQSGRKAFRFRCRATSN